eukprot:SM000076S21781  [mRNA]  locus=s76:200970:202212:+ [translate_table: standard]
MAAAALVFARGLASNRLFIGGSLACTLVFLALSLAGSLARSCDIGVVRGNAAASAGLAWETNSDTLKDAFSSFGEVTDARVITDRQTGRSRGFGFVHFTEEGAAETAKVEMNGRELEGRMIRSPFGAGSDTDDGARCDEQRHNQCVDEHHLRPGAGHP